MLASLPPNLGYWTTSVARNANTALTRVQRDAAPCIHRPWPSRPQGAGASPSQGHPYGDLQAGDAAPQRGERPDRRPGTNAAQPDRCARADPCWSPQLRALRVCVGVATAVRTSTSPCPDSDRSPRRLDRSGRRRQNVLNYVTDAAITRHQ
jgi:hypothetical protein